MTVIKTK